VRLTAREPAPELSVTRDHSGIWLLLLVALAVALRLFRLGMKSLWLDEAESLILAQANWHVFIGSLVHRQANMAFYYFLLRIWIHLGSGAFVARSLSVLVGVAAIPAMYFLGRGLFGPKTARLAALLMCFHVFHIRYSQEARSYSLLVLLAILSGLALLRAVRDPSLGSWTRYTLAGTLMVYTHVFGYWVLLAQWISMLWLGKKIAGKRALVSVFLIHLFIAPLAFCLLVVSDRSQLAWLGKPDRTELYKFFLDLTGNGGALILLFCGLMILAAVGFSKKPEQDAGTVIDRWKLPLLLTWLFLPVAGVVVLSLRWAAFSPRFLIPCLPPMVLLVADGIYRIRPKVLGTVAILLLLGFWLNAAFSYYRSRADVEHSDDWRGATWYVLTQAEPGDAALFTFSEERLAFEEYQRQFQMDHAPVQQFPEGSDFDLLTHRPSRPEDGMVAQVADSHARVWVLSAFQPDPASRRTTTLLARRFRQYSARDFGFVRIELFADKVAATVN